MRFISHAISLSLSVVLLVSFTACAGKKVVYEGGAATKNTAAGEGLASSVEWLKNRKETIDVRMRFTNEYKTPVVIRMAKAKMTFGGVAVNPKDYGAVVELGAGISTERNLIFLFGPMKAAMGVAEIEIVPEQNGKDLPPLKTSLTVEANK
jgi:hypothetical protein